MGCGVPLVRFREVRGKPLQHGQNPNILGQKLRIYKGHRLHQGPSAFFCPQKAHCGEGKKMGCGVPPGGCQGGEGQTTSTWSEPEYFWVKSCT